LKASVAGVKEQVNKLISIKPLKSRYNGEIGDVVVGRITEVQQKRWKVDTNARLESVLLLSSVNLPGGELVCIFNSIRHFLVQLFIVLLLV
jgi:exosome complex component RRP4